MIHPLNEFSLKLSCAVHVKTISQFKKGDEKAENSSPKEPGKHGFALLTV